MPTDVAKTVSEALTPERVGSALAFIGAAAWYAWTKFAALRGGKSLLKTYAELTRRAAEEKEAPSHLDIAQPDPELDSRIQRLEKMAVLMSEWSLDEARAQVRKLQTALEARDLEDSRKAMALAEERGEREKVEKALADALDRAAQAERERDAALKMGQAAIDELTASKRAAASGHSTQDHRATPLVPPPLPPLPKALR